jgi:hypothetical protein
MAAAAAAAAAAPSPANQSVNVLVPRTSTTITDPFVNIIDSGLLNRPALAFLLLLLCNHNVDTACQPAGFSQASEGLAVRG